MDGKDPCTNVLQIYVYLEIVQQVIVNKYIGLEKLIQEEQSLQICRNLMLIHMHILHTYLFIPSLKGIVLILLGHSHKFDHKDGSNYDITNFITRELIL